MAGIGSIDTLVSIRPPLANIVQKMVLCLQVSAESVNLSVPLPDSAVCLPPPEAGVSGHRMTKL